MGYNQTHTTKGTGNIEEILLESKSLKSRDNIQDPEEFQAAKIDGKPRRLVFGLGI